MELASSFIINMTISKNIKPLCLSFLKIGGCYPKRSLTQNIIYILSFLTHLCIFYLVLYQICSTEFSFPTTFQCLESLFILTQVCIKFKLEKTL